MRYICYTYYTIWFQRFTKIHTNTNFTAGSGVHQASFFSQNCSQYYARSSEELQKVLMRKWDQWHVGHKKLLELLKSSTFNHVTSIKSFEFSTLYTTIPHKILKNRLTSIIQNAFIFKNGISRYKYLVLGHEETCFVKEYSDSKNSEEDVIKMLEFLVENSFVFFAEKDY